MLTTVAFGLALLSAILGILVACSVVGIMRCPPKANGKLNGKEYILGSGFFMGGLIFCGGLSIMLHGGFSLTLTGYLFLISLVIAFLSIGQLLYVQFLRIKSMNLYHIELPESSRLDPDGK